MNLSKRIERPLEGLSFGSDPEPNLSKRIERGVDYCVGAHDVASESQQEN